MNWHDFCVICDNCMWCDEPTFLSTPVDCRRIITYEDSGRMKAGQNHTMPKEILEFKAAYPNPDIARDRFGPHGAIYCGHCYSVPMAPKDFNEEIKTILANINPAELDDVVEMWDHKSCMASFKVEEWTNKLYNSFGFICSGKDIRKMAEGHHLVWCPGCI